MIAGAQPKTPAATRTGVSPDFVLRLVVFGVLIAVICWASIAMPRDLGRAAPIWPANALVLTVLMISPRPRWPAWLASAFLGALAANLVADDNTMLSVAWAACNTLEIAASAFLLRRFVGPQFDISRVRDVVLFFLIAGVATPLAAAAVATLAAALLDGGGALTGLATWAAADGLGAMILTPLLLCLWNLRARLRYTPMKATGWMSLAIVAATTAFAMEARQPVLFLIPPAMLLAVFELEVLGAALAILIIVAVAVVAAALGADPMGALSVSPGDRLIVSQIFLAAITLTSFTTGAVLAQRRRFEGQYRLLAESATDIVLKVDRDDVISYISPSAKRYGYEPDELIGLTGYSLLHPDDLPKLREIIVELFGGGEVDPERDRTYRIRTADGQHVWMEGNPAIIRDEDGEPVAVVSQLRDITQRKAMEAELRAAREEAEAAAAVKADFLANMSHELRTPLTAVLGFTRLTLEQPDLSETTRSHVSKASHAGAALLTTVNDILDFSKLESGQLQIRREPCDVDEVCRTALGLFSATAEAKEVSLSYAAHGLPPYLLLDPNRLRQLLLNLIGNAVKFSDGGEVRLTVSWGDGRLSVAVEDDGPGIAPEQQPLLFRRFSQVDGSATRRHGGTGLGLAICRGLVDAMAGDIGVESEVGQGARFFFELPAEPCDAAAAEATTGAAFPVGVRVLVADDHAVNRELVRAILTPLGAEVVEAADGAEAAALAGATPFDVILMDLRMPQLDGLGALAAIRAGDGPNRTAPILAFSAGADAPGAADRRRAGFDGDLAKPLMPADLIAAVAGHAGPKAPVAPKRRRRALSSGS